MQDISVSPNIQDLLKKHPHIPSPPTVAVQILRTVQNPESSIDDLGKIVSADPGLSAKMLRIANSAFYSLPCEVRSINRALAILGTNVIKNIALSFVFVENMGGDDSSHFDFDFFWRRAVTAGVAAETICGLIEQRNEDIFVTALLNDLGVLLMFLMQGREYTKLLDNNNQSREQRLVELERAKYQFDHQKLGVALLEEWGIPAAITVPIFYHHDPELAPEEIRQNSAILQAANLVSAICCGKETAKKVIELEKVLEHFFNVPTEKIPHLLDAVADKAIDVLDIFNVDSGEMKPYSQLLQEANDELGKLNLSYEQMVLELKESKDKAERFANELRDVNSKLEQLAFRDGLTDLYNHRYFQEMLGKEIYRCQDGGHPLSLLMFDIDYFKKINDSFGHPAGDQVLANLSSAIKDALRPSDIVARYGGEEFAVILPETNQSGLKVFAERLRRCAAAVTTKTNGNEIRVTISCGGVELSPDIAGTKQDLLDTADRALYMSKKNGRNCVTIQDLEPTLN